MNLIFRSAVAAIVANRSGHLEVLANMMGIMVICRRGEIDLCARLLGIAAAGLNENPGLLGFVVAAKFSLLSVMLPLLAFSGLAYTNGDLAPNSKSHADSDYTLSPHFAWRCDCC